MPVADQPAPQSPTSERDKSSIMTPASAAGTEWVLVVIDTETTGVYDQDKIVQLAARTVYADGSGVDDFFNQLVHPGLDGTEPAIA